MGAEEAALEEKGEGNSILVGIQMDKNGRDLLNWTLEKVAKCGDCIVAVNVCRLTDLCKTSKISLSKLLKEFLAEYKGICCVKQVVLVGRVSQGSCIKKVLVKEAEICAARTIVVGINKNNGFRRSDSMARYCAKKLPATTNLWAVENEKVIFERKAAKPPPGEETKPILRSPLHPSPSVDAKIIDPHDKVNSQLAVSRTFDDELFRDVIEKKVTNYGIHSLNKIVVERNSSSPSLAVDTLPETKPGWPLLRRSVSENSEVFRGTESRKMSVVQWVMSLPNRSLPSTPQHRSDETQDCFGQDKSSTSVNLSKELDIVLETNASSCRWFTLSELQNSTSNFSTENLIGKGGYSKVYKGCLLNGHQVAVKRTELSEESSRDFLLEVNILSTLQHGNIRPLVGICTEGNDLISVYRFFSKGSLEEHLHGTRTKLPLTWEARFKVAVGVAEALNYLHNGCSRPVVHRDVKSSNILLSDEFEPQLSDFGLALWAPTTSSHMMRSDVFGTFGYLAPEYFMFGKVSEKIDVYSFGVVLLELLTGRKPISSDNSKGQGSLITWATSMLEQGTIMDILDPNLVGKCNEEQMRRMASAAALCIRRSARLRPRISQVLQLLQGKDLGIWLTPPDNSADTELDNQDDEVFSPSSIASHRNLALLDVGEVASVSSTEGSC